MKNLRVENLTLHNNRGQSVLYSDLSKWTSETGQFEIFGPVETYSWNVDGVTLKFSENLENCYLQPLPNGIGFVSFEQGFTPDNCLLLDVYGKEVARLTVPWELTKERNPKSALPPTSFSGIGTPCVNPCTGKLGSFGLSAWVEFAGDYYFEFDYLKGVFLWGLEVRR